MCSFNLKVDPFIIFSLFLRISYIRISLIYKYMYINITIHIHIWKHDYIQSHFPTPTSLSIPQSHVFCFIFIYVYGLFLCGGYVHMGAMASEARRGCKIPGAGVMGCFQSHYLDLNLGPLESSMHSQLLNSSPAHIFIHFLNNDLVKEKKITQK